MLLGVCEANFDPLNRQDAFLLLLQGTGVFANWKKLRYHNKTPKGFCYGTKTEKISLKSPFFTVPVSQRTA
jgi:hypothetical protein